MPFYPDISATTPKVSLFNFESQGEELINASIKQADEFSDIATTKVGFMTKNQEEADSTVKFVPCVIQNATGVRLSLIDFTKPVGYPAPALIEPGECASFLGGGDNGTISYQVQVFEGPFAYPGGGGGWQAPSKAGFPPKDVSIPTFQLEYQQYNPEAISYGAKIQLVNQYAITSDPDGYGRFLDTGGIVGNTTPPSLGVQSSPSPDRDNGSGTWKIILQQEAVTPSTAPAFVQDMKNPNEPFETKLVWTRNDQALPVNVFKITQLQPEP